MIRQILAHGNEIRHSFCQSVLFLIVYHLGIKSKSYNVLSLTLLQVLTDPSGNSFLENPHAPKSDPFCEVSHFLRTREQDHDLGIYTADEVASKEAADDDPAAAAEDTELSSTTSSTLLLRCQEGEVTSCSEEASSLAEQQKIDGREATGTQPEVALPRVLSATEAMEAASAVSTTTPTTSDKQHGSSKLTEDLREEVLNFPTNCPECGAPADTKMKLTSKFP